MDPTRPLGLTPRPRKRKKYLTLGAAALLVAAGLVLAAMVASDPAEPPHAPMLPPAAH